MELATIILFLGMVLFSIGLLIFDIVTTWRQTKAQERSAAAAERGNQIQQNIAATHSQFSEKVTEQVKNIADNTTNVVSELKKQNQRPNDHNERPNDKSL